MFWKKKSFERKHLSQPFDNKSWYQKKNKLNLILTNPELFIIYWTGHHLFWFRFLKLLLIVYYQSSRREIGILKEKDCRYRNNCGIRLHAGDLEQPRERKKIGLYMFFLSFLYSALPDLDLEILKMVICVCFRDVLQPGVC